MSVTMQDGAGDGGGSESGSLWDEANAGCWTPECWHKSPQQMVDEARSQLWAGDSHITTNAAKHSQPPTMPWMRDT